jgi:transposase
MSVSPSVYVGIDLHKDWVSLAAIAPFDREPFAVRTVPNDMRHIRRFLRPLRESGEVAACYEASGGGYVLQRKLARLGVRCEVIAPSLIPRRSGDRRKTDERDACELARLYRGGLLTAVGVPDLEREQVRSAVRMREVFKRDVHRSRQHVLKLLRCRGHVFPGKRHWTEAHWRWLRALQLESEDAQTLESYLVLLESKLEALAQADRRIADLAQRREHRGPVGRLRCLRGVDTLSAMVLVSEIGDVRRFSGPRALMDWVGLTVSEHSSGGPGRQRMGGITKAGNRLCRFVLVEAAWHYRHRPLSGRDMRRRWEGQDELVIAHARRAQRRLCRRYRQLSERMDTKTAVTAVARELCGFVWALLLAESDVLRPKPQRTR